MDVMGEGRKEANLVDKNVANAQSDHLVFVYNSQRKAERVS
jgi:hypothetical protein